MEYKDIIDRTLEAIPEIRAPYEKESARWRDQKMGPYNLFDIILMPHLLARLRSDAPDGEMARAFDFLETLATHRDPEIRNIVGVAICEELSRHEAELQKAVRYMGPRTKEFCDMESDGK